MAQQSPIPQNNQLLKATSQFLVCDVFLEMHLLWKNGSILENRYVPITAMDVQPSEQDALQNQDAYQDVYQDVY